VHGLYVFRRNDNGKRLWSQSFGRRRRRRRRAFGGKDWLKRWAVSRK